MATLAIVALLSLAVVGVTQDKHWAQARKLNKMRPRPQNAMGYGIIMEFARLGIYVFSFFLLAVAHGIKVVVSAVTGHFTKTAPDEDLSHLPPPPAVAPAGAPAPSSSTAQPASTQSASTQSASTQSASAQPASAQPASTQTAPHVSLYRPRSHSHHPRPRP